jgi:hypothetical protein
MVVEVVEECALKVVVHDASIAVLSERRCCYIDRDEGG